jgi:hypothetical protein
MQVSKHSCACASRSTWADPLVSSSSAFMENSCEVCHLS